MLWRKFRRLRPALALILAAAALRSYGQRTRRTQPSNVSTPHPVSQPVDKVTTHRVPCPAALLETLDSSPTTLSLWTGDLPGYTGWRRPHHTLAPYFELVSINSALPGTPVTVSAGDTLEIVLRCNAQEKIFGAAACRHGGSGLFARAIGAAVVAAKIHDRRDGSYLLSFKLNDPGQYRVEIVLEYSVLPQHLQTGAPARDSSGEIIDPDQTYMYEVKSPHASLLAVHSLRCSSLTGLLPAFRRARGARKSNTALSTALVSRR